MIELEKLKLVEDKLGKEGLLLTSGTKPNTMVISWGSVGVFWNEAIFIAPVRLSRFTREKIDETGVFSICVPTDSMKSSLKVFGAESGRDVDKYLKAGVSATKCKSIPTYAIKDASLTIECEVVAEMEMDADTADETIRSKWYDDENYHIMYYGKIVNIY